MKIHNLLVENESGEIKPTHNNSSHSGKDITNALINGTLIQSLALEKKEVVIHLKPDFNEADYRIINETLYWMYRYCKDFNMRFSLPKLGTHAPYLMLKEYHGYKNVDDIVTEIKNFAKQLKAKKVFKPIVLAPIPHLPNTDINFNQLLIKFRNFTPVYERFDTRPLLALNLRLAPLQRVKP